jgi:hypothetical protein
MEGMATAPWIAKAVDMEGIRVRRKGVAEVGEMEKGDYQRHRDWYD